MRGRVMWAGCFDVFDVFGVLQQLLCFPHAVASYDEEALAALIDRFCG